MPQQFQQHQCHSNHDSRSDIRLFPFPVHSLREIKSSLACASRSSSTFSSCLTRRALVSKNGSGNNFLDLVLSFFATLCLLDHVIMLQSERPCVWKLLHAYLSSLKQMKRFLTAGERSEKPN